MLQPEARPCWWERCGSIIFYKLIIFYNLCSSTNSLLVKSEARPTLQKGSTLEGLPHIFDGDNHSDADNRADKMTPRPVGELVLCIRRLRSGGNFANSLILVLPWLLSRLSFTGTTSSWRVSW